MPVKIVIYLVVLSGIAGILTLPAKAELPNAAEREVRWFAGKWAVGPADIPGFETIAGTTDCKTAVDISTTGPATIRRAVRLRNGELRSNEFTVKSFNGNFPWWSKDGIGGPVAKRTGANSFVLAATRNSKADWPNALQHTRCPE